MRSAANGSTDRMAPGHPETLTPRWYPLRYHPVQDQLIRSPARFKVVPAGRRSGKSERAKRNLVIQGIRETLEGRWQDPRYFFAAPTREQAKAIAWNDLKALIPRYMMDGPPRETDLMIRLTIGTEFWVIGLDKPQRMEGRAWNGGVIDEIANVKPSAWGENIRPALSDRDGWCWLIGVPEGRGAYYEWYRYATSGEDSEWEGFSWLSADILSAKEIESARRTLDPGTFDQEYCASFLVFAGRVYYPFDERTHCAPLPYRAAAPLNICLDWNVEPGTAAICQEMKLPNGLDGTGVIGEVYITRNSTTPAVCRKIIQDWGHHPGPVVCYGDATDGARGTARVLGSDWDLVRAELGPVFGDRLRLKVPAANPPERARVNAVNSRLMNAAGEIRLMVDPAKAPHVVKDFEGVRLLEGGSGEIDKKADPMLSHLTDSIGYMVAREFPIATRKATVAAYAIHG